MAKASGTATHFSVPSANPGTPRKKGANGIAKKATPKKANGTKGGAGKRKRGGGMSDGYVHLLVYLSSTCNTDFSKGKPAATTPNLIASSLTTMGLISVMTRPPRRRQRSTAQPRPRARARAKTRARSKWKRKTKRRRIRPSMTRAMKMHSGETMVQTWPTMLSEE